MYKIQISNSESSQLDYYDYVRFEDMRLLADGKSDLDMSSYETARMKWNVLY